MAAAVAFALLLLLATGGALGEHDPALEPCGDEELCAGTGVSPGDEVAAVQALLAPKCTLCVKLLEAAAKALGEEPDEDAARAALATACKAVGRRAGRWCRRLVRSFGEQLAEALANGDDPRDTCVAMRLCKR